MISGVNTKSQIMRASNPHPAVSRRAASGATEPCFAHWLTLRHFDTPHAFTLIEIMLAISIGAIIMAIGLPAFVNAMRKEDLRKAVSEVVEGCSHARAQAILKGVPMEFVIRAEDGSLSVQPARLRNSGEPFGKEASQVGQSAAESATLPSGFSSQLPSDVGVKLVYVNLQDKMELPEARVRFFPNGTSDEFTVILFSTKGEKKISLDLVTGLADVETLR